MGEKRARAEGEGERGLIRRGGKVEAEAEGGSGEEGELDRTLWPGIRGGLSHRFEDAQLAFTFVAVLRVNAGSLPRDL